MADKKKQAVILLGHGSRVTNAGQNMEKVAAKRTTFAEILRVTRKEIY